MSKCWLVARAMAVAACFVKAALAGPTVADAILVDENCPAASPSVGNDYRNQRQMLQNVENNHFTPNIEALVRGNTGSLGAELAYVLGMFPNHPRALVALRRLSERQKTEHPTGAKFSIGCYFERALQFRQDDVVVRMLYVQYLIERARTEEALRHLEYVAANAGDNPMTNLNAGMLYAELKQYDKAAEQARVAQNAGVPSTELINRLKAVGKWEDPPGPEAKP